MTINVFQCVSMFFNFFNVFVFLLLESNNNWKRSPIKRILLNYKTVIISKLETSPRRYIHVVGPGVDGAQSQWVGSQAPPVSCGYGSRCLCSRSGQVGCPLPLLAVGLGRLSAVSIHGSVHVRVDVADTCSPAVVDTIYNFNCSIFQFCLKSFKLVLAV